MERRWSSAVLGGSASAAEESLIFFGQGELASFADGSDASADERMKSVLDPALVASRRRVVRRPLGAGYGGSQAIVFSDRDASPSLASSEPLSELLQQLAASRKSMLEGTGPVARAPRGLAGSSGASGTSAVLSSLGLTAEGAESRGTKRAAMGEHSGANPTEQMRAYFVQELMLSALAGAPVNDDAAP